MRDVADQAGPPIAGSSRAVATPGQERQVHQTCSGPGRILQGRAEFRFHPGLDVEFPPTAPRTTPHGHGADNPLENCVRWS